MKTISSFLAIIMAVCFIPASQAQSPAQLSKQTVEVWGNCEMCKARIEKAAKSAGATTADWNEETKILEITFSPDKTSATSIEKKIAAVGHDTKNFTAPDAVYNKLAGCCKYDRKQTTNDVSLTNNCCTAKCTMDNCCNAYDECKAGCTDSSNGLACCKLAANGSMTCNKNSDCCSSSKKI